jgi:hypothetical protein
MMGVERGGRKRRYLRGMQGKRKDGTGNFRSGSVILLFRQVHLSSNTWIGEAEGRYGGDEMIAEL